MNTIIYLIVMATSFLGTVHEESATLQEAHPILLLQTGVHFCNGYDEVGVEGTFLATAQSLTEDQYEDAGTLLYAATKDLCPQHAEDYNKVIETYAR